MKNPIKLLNSTNSKILLTLFLILLIFFLIFALLRSKKDDQNFTPSSTEFLNPSPSPSLSIPTPPIPSPSIEPSQSPAQTPSPAAASSTPSVQPTEKKKNEEKKEVKKEIKNDEFLDAIGGSDETPEIAGAGKWDSNSNVENQDEYHEKITKSLSEKMKKAIQKKPEPKNE